MENPDIDRPAVHIGLPLFRGAVWSPLSSARRLPPLRRFCCSPPFFCFFCLSSIGNGRISCFPSSLPQPHSRCLQLQ